MKPVGWRREPYRHSLAAKGIKTRTYSASKLDRFWINEMAKEKVGEIRAQSPALIKKKIEMMGYMQPARLSPEDNLALLDTAFAIATSLKPDDPRTKLAIVVRESMERDRLRSEKSELERVMRQERERTADLKLLQEEFEKSRREGTLSEEESADLEQQYRDVIGEVKDTERRAAEFRNVVGLQREVARGIIGGSRPYGEKGFRSFMARKMFVAHDYVSFTEKGKRYEVPLKYDGMDGEERSDWQKEVAALRKMSLGAIKRKYDLDSKKPWFMARKVFKKGKIHVTQEGPEVIRLAKDVKRSIEPYAKRVEIAGSIRRGKKDPVDVDIVVIPRDEQKIREVLKKRADRVDAEGKSKIETHIRGVDVDVMFAKPEDWGGQMLRWTGPYGHNIGLSRIAQRKGLKLSQYGLFRGDRRIAGRTEREIYQKLGRPRFKGPEERE